jgi:hypothetical protein
MNERNVEALVDLLNDQSFGAPLDRASCREVAAFLASRGVLVPSALTGVETTRVLRLATLPIVQADIELRSELERIAKG